MTVPGSSASKQAGFVVSGWPSLLLTVIVVFAAIIAFAHRPLPPFPATQLRPDQLLVTGLAREGNNLLAVGEQGRILYSELPGKSWRVAKVDPQRGSTFTQVIFAGAGLALAVGHDGWIVRSVDAGKTWKEVAFTEQSDALLGIAGPFGGNLFAYGAFGLMMTSTDLGESWQRVEAPPAAPDPAANPDDAAFAPPPSGPLGDRHINAMIRAGDGSILAAGERGLLALSRDDGKTWTVLPDIYPGSFYGAVQLPAGDLLVFGMRGNSFRSGDQGATWQKVEMPVTVSLFGGAVAADGEVVLVGASNTVLVSKDGGNSFTLASKAGRQGYAAVLPLEGGKRLLAGEAGLSVQ